MAAEKVLRGHVVKILRKAGLDACAVENPIMSGYPDVEFIGGTMELKAVANWPAKPETPLRLPHYTQEQRVWATRRWNKGGNTTLLLQVAKQYLLLTGPTAATLLGHVNQTELAEAALAEFDSLAALRNNLAQAVSAARQEAE